MTAMDGLELGYRFHPTPSEVLVYLTRKALDPDFTCSSMGDLDIYRFEPWDLPGKAKSSRANDTKWWFFSIRDSKTYKGARASRTTPSGYWKASGRDRQIRRGGDLVGVMKTLVFYIGRNNRGQKSDWVMHEYRLAGSLPHPAGKDGWAVCCVFSKKDDDQMAPAGDAALEISAAALSPPPPVVADEPVHVQDATAFLHASETSADALPEKNEVQPLAVDDSVAAESNLPLVTTDMVPHANDSFADIFGDSSIEDIFADPAILRDCLDAAFLDTDFHGFEYMWSVKKDFLPAAACSPPLE